MIQTKKLIVIAFFALIGAAVSACGCSGLIGGESSPTPTVIYGPVATPRPTPTPAPTAGPAVGHSKPSNDVFIITPSLDYKFISDGKTRDGKQYENITLVVMNSGSQEAPNVELVVTVIDDRTLNTLAYQVIPVGSLARGEMRQMNFLTETHSPAVLIKAIIEVRWGMSGEYYNPILIEKVRSFPL